MALRASHDTRCRYSSGSSAAARSPN